MLHIEHGRPEDNAMNPVPNLTLSIARAKAALQLTYVADALSMPVHWYYNPLDIIKAFPQGIYQFEAAPAFHPSSIMPLHSTFAGGRGAQSTNSGASEKNNSKNAVKKEIVGEVILKGKRKFWGLANQHYHQGMQAGENTLNAHCARLVTRTLNKNNGKYNADDFLNAYVAFMTADTPQHPDTYAESYHRGFFANLESGKPEHQCGAATHDTPSVGGLVTIAPIAIAGLLRGESLPKIQSTCREHLWLTHPDEKLAKICADYVALIAALLFRDQATPAKNIIADHAKKSIGIDVENLVAKAKDDNEIVGGKFSKACYIDDSWPSLLYLAYKYNHTPEKALLANTNLGGENCHRGSVLGVLMGLSTGDGLDKLFLQ